MSHASQITDTELTEPVAIPRGQETLPSSPAERVLETVRVLSSERRFLWRATGFATVVAVALAFLIPKEYQSAVRLMPPDTQSGSSMAMLAALSGKAGGGLGALAGDLMGLKSSGELFVGILESRTVQDRLIDRF